jgi:hypothetical protein
VQAWTKAGDAGAFKADIIQHASKAVQQVAPAA